MENDEKENKDEKEEKEKEKQLVSTVFNSDKQHQTLIKKIKMEVDVLDYATKEVLYKDKKQRFIVYLSKSLNKIERNYDIVVATTSHKDQ